jgi:NOL1/NOP2/fmu family ribosome biogenesis protein
MFDRVIVDAPCSGEALFRRDPASRAQWSEAGVRGAARRQRKLLASALRTVRAGGALAYSTCTFGTEENEDRVREVLADNPKWTLAEPPDWPGVDRVDLGSGQVLRFYPHHCRCEGQFVAILRAPDDIPRPPRARSRGAGASSLPAWNAFAKATLRRDIGASRIVSRADTYYLTPTGIDLPAAAALRPGLLLGRVHGVTFRPSHALAMTLRPGDVTAHERLDGEDVREFRSGLALIRPGPPGWVLVTVEDWPIGWGQRRGHDLVPRLPGHAQDRQRR